MSTLCASERYPWLKSPFNRIDSLQVVVSKRRTQTNQQMSKSKRCVFGNVLVSYIEECFVAQFFQEWVTRFPFSILGLSHQGKDQKCVLERETFRCLLSLGIVAAHDKTVLKTRYRCAVWSLVSGWFLLWQLLSLRQTVCHRRNAKQWYWRVRVSSKLLGVSIS